MEKKFSAHLIVLGFTGSIGSGCSSFANCLTDKFPGYFYCSLSKILREKAKANDMGGSIEELQSYGNKIRKENKESVLVEMLIKELEANEDFIKDVENNDIKGIVVDSIRNDGEVKTLRQLPNFYLFSIHADKSVRCERTVGEKKRFRTKEDFDKADRRDEAENISYGQQVKKCNYLADIILNNNDNVSSRNLNESIFDKLRKYIFAIEEKIRGYKIHPTTNEALMTIAYATSQSSVCLKRKVGAVIATIEESPNPQRDPLYSVISSGFNHVPIGSIPCLNNVEYGEKCYRDHLQEQQASTIKYCPKCGREIKVKFKHVCDDRIENEFTEYFRNCPKCKKEIDIPYVCEGCNSKVFSEYLLSGGKLMDMCRSLHAEENALMGISKNSDIVNGKLTLFTTTYPCNLCANKIVSAGIKKVVYSDPYTMEDARSILEGASVSVEKFEGIKSIAFFKIFD